MTHPTPDPLRAALDTIRQIVADAQEERNRFGYIAATIRVNAIRAGASSEEADAMVRGDKPFIDWLAKQYEARRLEDLAAAPQPAPAPADDRAALIEVIREAAEDHWLAERPKGVTYYGAIADALLAAGWTRGGDAAALREAAAGATTAIAHALDDGDVRDDSAGSLEASLNALNAALSRPAAPETRAWAVIRQGRLLDVHTIFNEKPDHETWNLPPDSTVYRVAIRVVEDEA